MSIPTWSIYTILQPETSHTGLLLVRMSSGIYRSLSFHTRRKSYRCTETLASCVLPRRVFVVSPLYTTLSRLSSTSYYIAVLTTMATRRFHRSYPVYHMRSHRVKLVYNSTHVCAYLSQRYPLLAVVCTDGTIVVTPCTTCGCDEYREMGQYYVMPGGVPGGWW